MAKVSAPPWSPSPRARTSAAWSCSRRTAPTKAPARRAPPTPLVHPGLPTLTKNTYDALRLPWRTIEQALDANLTLEQVFEQHADRAEAPDLTKLVRQRRFGKADVVAQWIADSWLPADEKAALTRFVQRFPTIEFFRADVSVIDSIVPRITPAIPAHYRRMTTVLEGWISVAVTPGARFDQFQGWSPRGARASTMTYLLQVMGHGGDVRGPMLAEGFMVIGQSLDSPLSMLAMRRDDPAIYEYAEEDILDAISEKRDITTSIRSIFPSYWTMLDHIVAIYPDPNASESIAAASH
jgi:hypothetical protein